MKRFNNATAPSLDRRESTSTAILALLSGVTITVIGCGDSDTPPSPSATSGDRTGGVTASHGHVAVLNNVMPKCHRPALVRPRRGRFRCAFTFSAVSPASASAMIWQSPRQVGVCFPFHFANSAASRSRNIRR